MLREFGIKLNIAKQRISPRLRVFIRSGAFMKGFLATLLFLTVAFVALS